MRFLTWTLRIAVFLFLVALGARNADPVTVRFYFDLAVQAPLILVLFAAFAGGALFGVLALLGTVFRQRRQIASLRGTAPPAPPAEPPAPPRVAGL